jgi:lipid-A-disaccharide synthase
LPLILRRIRDTARLVVATRPDALVIIDSPDFTHRVARRVRAAAPSIPILNYVSPSVWAWRPGRARAMRSYVDHVLALLPFEPRAHARLGGPPCTYVGHPLLEQLAQLRPNAQEAQRRLAEPPVVLVLPGSRDAEIRRLLATFGQALAILAAGREPPDIVLPTLPHLREQITAATAGWAPRPRIVVDFKDKRAAFRVARAALAKSGTVTLELALAGVPMVAAYKVTWLEEIVMRLVSPLTSVILPNLILEENVVPEFLQRDCTAQNLGEALVPLWRRARNGAGSSTLSRGLMRRCDLMRSRGPMEGRSLTAVRNLRAGARPTSCLASPGRRRSRGQAASGRNYRRREIGV